MRKSVIDGNGMGSERLSWTCGDEVELGEWHCGGKFDKVIIRKGNEWKFGTQFKCN